MNKLGKVAVALAMAFSVGAAFGYTSASYVQDGLVHQWDGIENAGIGQSDTTASVWVDLKGDAGLTLKDEKSQFTGTALTRSALNYAYAKADTAITGVKTVEVTFRRAAYQTYAVILSLEGYTDNGRGILTMKNDGLGSTYHGYHDSYDATHCEFVTVALYADVAKGADNLFVDGVALPSTSASEGWSSGMANEFTLGGRWTSSGANCFSGEIFSCRLYDRYLSPEELVKNAKVDAIRFNGASGGDTLMVTGTPEDYGEVSPAYGTTTGLIAGKDYPCIASKVWTNETETVVATCVGYKILVDGVVSEEKTFGEADEAAFTYVYPDCILGAELVWRWTTKYRVLAETTGGGTVRVSGDGWFAPGETVTVTAEYDPDALAIHRWEGVSGTTDGDTFTFVMPDKPVVCTAKIARRFAVAVTGDDGAAGTLSAPFATLGQALSAAADLGAPSVVSVGPGEYELTAGLSYAGAEPVRVFSEEGAEKTILVRTTAFDNMLTLDNKDSTFDGFTFMQRDQSKSGHVLDIEAGTVSHCIVSNTWFKKGVKISTGGCLTDSLICGNHQSDRASVVSMEGGTIERCQIVRNMTSDGTYGEGLEFWSGGTARNCLIADNTNAYNHASGIYAVGGTILVENCTIANNVTLGATAVAGVVGTVGTFRNCIVYGNRNAGGISETADRTYVNCASSAVLSGSGNVRVAAMDFADAAAGDYRVLSGPTIDTALPQSWMLAGTDLAGNPRVIGEGPDMGCYEYKPGALRASVVASGTDFLGSGNVTLTASLSGSDLTGVTYDWRVLCNGETVATGDEATLTLTGLGCGVYDVRLTVANAAGDSFTWEDGASLITVHPKTVYVAKDSTPTPPYASWGTAARELADALEGAVDGMDVQVGAGVYTNTRCAIITAKIQVKGVEGRDKTVFERAQSGFQLLQMANADARFEGITFRQPQRNAASGGRVFTLSAGTIADCSVENCYASGDELSYVTGGLVTNTIWRGNFNSGRFSNCTINGGKLVGCTFRGIQTESDAYGGAIMASDDSVIRNCLICDCTNTSMAAGITPFNGNPLIENCTIVRNVVTNPNATNVAAGVERELKNPGRAMTLRNCIVWGNVAAGVETNVSAGVNFVATYSLCDKAGEGNVSGDPRFVGSTWRLKPSSPAVDAGLNQGWMDGAVDLNGNARIYGADRGGIVDMGCFECIPVGLMLLVK